MEQAPQADRLTARGTIRIGTAIRDGWNGILRHPGPALGGVFLYLLIVGGIGAIPFAGPLASLLVVPAFIGGLTVMLLNIQKGRNPKIGDLFEGFNRFGELLGLYWLQVLIGIALVLPMIIAAVVIAVVAGVNAGQLQDPGSLSTGVVVGGSVVFVAWLFLVIAIVLGMSMSFYLMMDRRTRAGQSISWSFSLTSGQRWRILLLGVVVALLQIAGLLCLVIGTIVTIPLAMIAFASAYTQLLGEEPERGTGETPPAAAPSDNPYTSPPSTA